MSFNIQQNQNSKKTIIRVIYIHILIDYWLTTEVKINDFFLQIQDYQASVARLEVNDSANKSNITNEKFKIQTLVKESKLALTFIDGFGYGGKKIQQVWEFLDQQNPDQEQIDKFFKGTLLHKFSVFDWDLNGRNQPCK